ncbi:MAG: hypothetical protein KIT84_11260 [Labilithrix sp.]|nr:hypothetical protein [Labilithrix sp.]MCW5811587.1 hypothetical protein [Labilithrix sp.]
MSIEEALLKVKGSMTCSQCIRGIENFVRALGDARVERDATERTPRHLMAAMTGGHEPRPFFDLA